MIVVFDLLLYLSLSPRVVAACSCCCRCVDDRVAELGSLSSGAKMVMEILVKRVFTISSTNA